MEHIRRPYSVESCWRISIQGHCASLCLPGLVFGVPAENIGPPPDEMSSAMLAVAPAQAKPHAATNSLTPPEWLQSQMAEYPSTRLPLYAQVEDVLVAR